jgi:hypothetical protein
MSVDKRQILETYLRQQQGGQSSTTPSLAGGVNDQMVLYQEVPENISLEEFKNYVKKWLELDNYVKKAQEVVKEKKKQRDKLSEVITKFMCKYNIEDLNTKEGRIRCRTNVVKTPVSQKVVKQRITDYFKDNENQRQEIIQKLYEEDRGEVERITLRRLKIT